MVPIWLIATLISLGIFAVSAGVVLLGKCRQAALASELDIVEQKLAALHDEKARLVSRLTDVIERQVLLDSR